MLHSTSLLSCLLHLKWNGSSFFKWKSIVTSPALSLSKLLLFYSLQLMSLKYWLLSPCQSDDSWSQKLKPVLKPHVLTFPILRHHVYLPCYHRGLQTGVSRFECRFKLLYTWFHNNDTRQMQLCPNYGAWAAWGLFPSLPMRSSGGSLSLTLPHSPFLVKTPHPGPSRRKHP